jgi:hypothetical protein
MSALASIGHNAPPPREAHALHIEELLNEAQGFLDGEPIANQEQADAVGKLLGMLREARQGADTQRKIEKRPHDDAAREVQAAWAPLLDRVAMAEQVAKRALAPFLAAQEAIAQAEAQSARHAAWTAAHEAREALDKASPTDLAGRAQAVTLLKDASKAERAAIKAEKVKPMAAGLSRAVSLRSVWRAVLIDPVAALKHYRTNRPDELKAWLSLQADQDVRVGVRAIDGFAITEERIAQ